MYSRSAHMESSSSTLSTIRPSVKWLLKLVFRTGAHTIWDRVFVGRVRDAAVVPPRPSALTRQWLSAALAAGVSRFDYRGVSLGTSERGRLALEYEPGNVGPETAFVKIASSFSTRLANSPTAKAEETFFNKLRPDLGDIDVPRGIYSATDAASGRSIHLIEDLARTNPSVVFPTVATTFTRAQAESAVTLLARVHRTYTNRAEWFGLKTYPQWWESCLRIANVHAAVQKFARSEFCPPSLRGENVLWQAGITSIEAHRSNSRTLIHGDPHLGNWYLVDDRAGLLDWQCVSVGNWSRDLAYAMTTILTVEQRRSWERELVERYLDESGLGLPFTVAWRHYRDQIVGGLLMWAPTLFPPKGFPAMQPARLARELTTRISTAMVDLDVLR
jgi:aminoglycoside phosphotransferase (APT) family kinase protein